VNTHATVLVAPVQPVPQPANLKPPLTQSLQFQFRPLHPVPPPIVPVHQTFNCPPRQHPQPPLCLPWRKFILNVRTGRHGWVRPYRDLRPTVTTRHGEPYWSGGLSLNTRWAILTVRCDSQASPYILRLLIFVIILVERCYH
jgi:hypothetical protein